MDELNAYIVFMVLFVEHTPLIAWLVFGLAVALTIGGGWLKKRRTGIPTGRSVSAALLTEYALMVVCYTVLLRTWHSGRQVEIIPFWSYRLMAAGNSIVMLQAVLNVVLFMPIGVLYRCSVRYSRWWLLLVCASVFSMSIELMQWVLECGTVEVDDIFHNSLGAMSGYGLSLLIDKLRHKTHANEE